MFGRSDQNDGCPLQRAKVVGIRHLLVWMGSLMIGSVSLAFGDLPPGPQANDASQTSGDDILDAFLSQRSPLGVAPSTESTSIFYNMMPGSSVVFTSSDSMVVRSPTAAPPLSSLAQTSNQLGVATVIDNAISRWNLGSANYIAREINSLPTLANRQAALNSLSGEVYGTLQSLGLQIGDRSLRIFSDRIINNDIFLNYGDAVLLSDRGNGTQTASDALVVRGQYSEQAFSGWVQGYGSGGGWDSNGNATAADYRFGGIAYGIDLGRDETGEIGITGGNTFTTFDTDLQDHGRITSYQVGVYLVKRIDAAYLFSIFSYGRNNYSVNRQIQIGGFMDSPQSKLHGDSLSSYSELGWNLDGPSIRFQPFLGLQTLMLSNSRANESGAAGLNVAASNLNSLRTHVGGRLIAPSLIDDLGIQWTPYMSARWVADLAGQSPDVSASFNGGPAGASWTVTGVQSGRNFGLIGLGLTAQITDRLSLFANYDYQTAARFHSHTGGGGLLFEF